MKNIERKEVQEALAEFVSHSRGCVLNVCGMTCIDCPLSIDEHNCACNNAEQEILDWFNKEYKEPHKWEQWELEVLKRIPKEHKYIKSYKEGICIINNINHTPTCLRFKFDTLRDDEKIDIDEELKRNGMSR